MKKSKLISIAMIMVMMLVSCATYQKKLNRFQTFALNNPNELAKLCADKFPVKEVVKPGRIDTIAGKTILLPGKTIYIKGDSVKCPDQKVDCPPSTKARPDTVYREDTAKLFVAIDNYSKARDSVNILKGQLKTTKENLEDSKRKNTSKTVTIVVLGLIILSGLFLKIKGIL